ncbi:MAG: pentapeptide repeat-containing protein [Thiogranum sp.]|nr:pentapeptide repeat-containing protein [Thiogranum sp.]
MSEAEAGTYIAGRKLGQLEEPYQASDLTFGSIRLDGRSLKNADYQHCTFANISFKEARLQSSTFLDCVFIGCYFRRAELVNSSFVGCRFIDCQFTHIAVKSSRFPHSLFRGCQIDIEELEHNLPPEPNIREVLTRNLSLESSKLGLSTQARAYRMAEIRAREAHLRAAIAGQSQWYRDHFDGLARLRALLQLILSLLNRWLWGYGERVATLLRNLVLVAVFLFPACFYILRDGLRKEGHAPIEPLDLVYFSLDNVLPSDIRSGIQAIDLVPRVLAASESIFGVIVLALFAAYIFRWSLHR